MIKKLTKYGNSQALIIDKPILALIGIDKNSQLKITTDGRSLIITPLKSIRQSTTQKKMTLKQSLDESVKKYDKTMNKLAHHDKT